MWSWIVTVGCYLFAALSRWGASESRKRTDRVDGFLRSLKK
jgi:hypothetical protein